MLTEEELIQTYAAYRKAVIYAQRMFIEWEDAQRDLDAALYLAAINKEIIGTNEREREAYAHKLLANEYEQEYNIRRKLTEAKHELALAQLDLDLVNLRVGFVRES